MLWMGQWLFREGWCSVPWWASYVACPSSLVLPDCNNNGSLCLQCCAVPSHISLSATPWTVVCRVLLSMGLFRQEYWSGLPFPPLGDFPNPGIEPTSPALQADSLPSNRWGSLTYLEDLIYFKLSSKLTLCINLCKMTTKILDYYLLNTWIAWCQRPDMG